MSASSTASSSPPASSPPPSAQETDANVNQGAGEGVARHTSPMRISSSPMKSDGEESDGAIKSDDRSERSSELEITLELPARRGEVNVGGDDRTQPHVAAGDGPYNVRSLVSQEQTFAARTTPASGQRNLPSHPARDRKRRLTSTAEQGRLQRTRSGEMSRSNAQLLPHRSASMINPSSRGKANSAASGSSWSTAIDITSSPPEAGPSRNQRQGNRQIAETAMPIRASKVGSASSQGYGQVHIDAALRTGSSLSRNTDNPLPSLPWEARSRTRYQAQENDPRAGASWESVSSASAPRPRRRQYSNSLRDSMFEQHSQTGRQRGMSDAMRSSRNERAGDDMEPTLPPWQPDAEVTSCPICAVVFNFWHRKHHCRKCGRVVCASCSPHRITIPRQYIVRPPESSQPLESSPAPPRQIVDLTSDDDSIPIIQSINPALGGGEEVRLCNPCVPDPNPNPLGYGVRSRGHRSTNSLPSAMGNYISSEEETASNNQAHRGYSPEFLQELGYNVRQSLRDQGTERNGSRHHHDHSQSELPSPRHSATMTASSRRPTVSEQDLCPICGRQFPDISSEQPLEAREAHIRQCIENYGASVATTPAPTSTRRGPAPPPPPQPPPPVARMLEFTATEKDCIGEDAGPAECPICLVEYEVGDVLIRLECLCKFHKHCILGWFERKMECPTHKVS
ncbi:hypothetical protein N7493_002832 [Penicillium malachiteum]|uniref:RING-type E3 ubiquitin transferase n=1 Tax=Penicillium malachiteum TaxID=1324776 RepID=A0AAD6HT51_9EURO|nr:hypothetical protein N7493_002832 [Penicillium malachiteum]